MAETRTFINNFALSLFRTEADLPYAGGEGAKSLLRVHLVSGKEFTGYVATQRLTAIGFWLGTREDAPADARGLLWIDAESVVAIEYV